MPDEWKRAIARIDLPNADARRGAGFLITDRFVLTALHVVADRTNEPPGFYAEPIQLTFTEVGHHRTEAHVVSKAWNLKDDWVLLECDNPPDTRPIALLALDSGKLEWETYGFADAKPDGMKFDGHVLDWSGNWGPSRAIQLFSTTAAAADGAPVQGLSGAPCIVNEAAVGLLRTALLAQDPGRPPRNVAGTLYACPISTVLSQCPQLQYLLARRPGTDLDNLLKETLLLYLRKSLRDDQYARLDQAGETDPDRTTLLKQIFVDLEVEPRGGQSPDSLKGLGSPLLEGTTPADSWQELPSEEPISAMTCLLEERWRKIVIIGGPGQGKSTLGQYLAQVHRATWLERADESKQPSPGTAGTEGGEFTPKIPRVPFRIVLKELGQWLAGQPSLNSVEAYLAYQVTKAAAREVAPEHVQQILRAEPSLVIFDGLDEVIEPGLRRQMVDQIQDFLDRMQVLKANLLVLATSRPSGYGDEFNPKQFYHLELLPMSMEKVRQYALKWIDTKVQVKEDQQRVMDALAQCQQEEHTRLLLTTPLQVTIILLLIKDGGHPPAQREALFNEYWDIIFRRENAKGKGFIRSGKSLLFDLHAHLGYILQRRAATKNVGSLLSTTEFEDAVRSFLRARDSRSGEDIINDRVAQAVAEARGRLVLLVEPQPDSFGFELRSLQEFFAAAHLAETARDTGQRFDRLKAIALPAHWRNVALFFAGRIVRSFSGEAANILELVCRPIDRDAADRYLKRGAWLALDIAADGTFAANRDLQYSAVEYALTVLDTGFTGREGGHLQEALQRLSAEDQRDILGPLLEQKLKSLPLPHLAIALNACGQFANKLPAFLRGLETLLSSNRPEYIKAALALGFQYRVEQRWLAAQLEHYWSIWAEGDSGDALGSWWNEEPQYAQDVLSLWSPSRSHVCHLLNQLLLSPYWSWGGNLPTPSFILKPENGLKAPADQLIAGLQCLSLQFNELLQPSFRETTEQFGPEDGGRISLVDMTQPSTIAARLADGGMSHTQIESLLRRTDLVSPLKRALWLLYWAIFEPTEPWVSTFLEEAQDWPQEHRMQSNVSLQLLQKSWPLLAVATTCRGAGDQEALRRLQPYLSKAQEVAINEQVRAAVRSLAQQADREEWNEFLLDFQIGEVKILPDLIPFAERLGLSVGELVQSYHRSTFWTGSRQPYSPMQIHRIISAIEKALTRRQEDMGKFWTYPDWEYAFDHATLVRGKQLLVTLIGALPQRRDVLVLTVVLFLKLLAADETTLTLVPQLYTVLGDIKDIKEDLLTWWVGQCIDHVPLERLLKLAEFTRHKDKRVLQGALLFWESLIDSVILKQAYLPSPFSEQESQNVRSLRLDWQLGLPFIDSTNGLERKQGITLLALSNFPCADTARRNELLTAMARAQEDDEIQAWARLLTAIPISQFEKADLQGFLQLLESVLAQPREYSATILTAALERYATLVGEADPDIVGDETALGLPALARPKP